MDDVQSLMDSGERSGLRLLLLGFRRRHVHPVGAEVLMGRVPGIGDHIPGMHFGLRVRDDSRDMVRADIDEDPFPAVIARVHPRTEINPAQRMPVHADRFMPGAVQFREQVLIDIAGIDRGQVQLTGPGQLAQGGPPVDIEHGGIRPDDTVADGILPGIGLKIHIAEMVFGRRAVPVGRVQRRHKNGKPGLF